MLAGAAGGTARGAASAAVTATAPATASAQPQNDSTAATANSAGTAARRALPLSVRTAEIMQPR